MNSLAIISDIHGNLPALKAVLQDIDNQGVQEVICLGDLVGYYCDHNEVVELLQEREIPCIMGNHDYALAYNNGVISTSKTCTRILKWQLDNTEPSNIEYLKSLKSSYQLSLGAKQVLCVHGGLDDFVEEYVFDISAEYLKKFSFAKDVLLTGHTHIPSYKKYWSGALWINPGSVGQPRDFDNRSSYAVLNEDGTASFKKIAYDPEPLIERMRAFGFEEYISDPLKTGIKIGYVK
jgi:putative phosphoesterase